MKSNLKGIRILVKGRVQKVGFRKFVFQKAIELSVVGTVKNVGADTVEVFAKGTNMQLDELLEWCRSGPPLSKVIRVEVHAKEEVDCKEFKVIKNN